jgi:hypothetical protein
LPPAINPAESLLALRVIASAVAAILALANAHARLVRLRSTANLPGLDAIGLAIRTSPIQNTFAANRASVISACARADANARASGVIATGRASSRRTALTGVDAHAPAGGLSRAAFHAGIGNRVAVARGAVRIIRTLHACVGFGRADRRFTGTIKLGIEAFHTLTDFSVTDRKCARASFC